MRHHTNEEVCPLCKEKLKGADPRMAEWFLSSVKPLFHDCHISWSWRGQAAQDQAFREGKTKLHFPDSPHNKMNILNQPSSLALDLFKLVSGTAMFPPLYFAEIWEKCGRNDILWGRQFVQLGDLDHFQIKDGG